MSAIAMILAELKDAPNGKVIEKGVFLSLDELLQHDDDARRRGQCWSGTLETNIALNRYRHEKCVYCGAAIGQQHRNCVPGVVNRLPRKGD